MNALLWHEQPDPSVAADFLEHVDGSDAPVSRDAEGAFWFPPVPQALAELYGVVLRTGQPRGPIQRATDLRPAGELRGSGERVTLDPRESDAFLAAAFLLDRIEGVSLALNGTFLLDSAYAAGSTARARNFAHQFGLTVTLNDDPKLVARWELKRPRLGLMTDASAVSETLDRYRVPYTRTNNPSRPAFDTVIAGSLEGCEAFLRARGTVITPEVRFGFPLTPRTAKVLLRAVYLGSARAI